MQALPRRLPQVQASDGKRTSATPETLVFRVEVFPCLEGRGKGRLLGSSPALSGGSPEPGTASDAYEEYQEPAGPSHTVSHPQDLLCPGRCIEWVRTASTLLERWDAANHPVRQEELLWP